MVVITRRIFPAAPGRRVACLDCFGVRNSPHEPTRVVGSGGVRSSAVVGDVALRHGAGDSEGRGEVEAVVRRSARYSWQRFLHRCAPGRAADAGVAGADAWGHVVDLVW